MFSEVALPAGWAPYGLAGAADGAVWMTLVVPGALARLDPRAALACDEPGAGLALHAVAGGPCQPMQLTVGADGVVWYTRSDDRLGRRDAGGTEAVIDLPAGSAPYGIAVAGDDVWFTAPGVNRLGRLTGDGEVRTVELPRPAARPAMLTVAADGAVWAALNGAGALARWHGDEISIIDLPHDGTPVAPVGVAAAGDGVWYADISGGCVGYTDGAGAVERVGLAGPGCRPHAVAADPGGDCWVTLWASGQLARVDAGGAVTCHALPGGEPHGLLVTGTHVWVAMESGSLVAMQREVPA